MAYPFLLFRSLTLPGNLFITYSSDSFRGIFSQIYLNLPI